MDPSESAKQATGIINEQRLVNLVPAWWRKKEPILKAAEKRFKSKEGKPKILVINGSDRNVNTCPGEKPKSLLLCQQAVRVIRDNGGDPHLLDLSRITSEADKMIYSCKACFSTSPALCHYGCTCVAKGQRITSVDFKPIEKVTEGDQISTGNVRASWMTSKRAEVYKICISDGRRVRLTANHLIKTIGQRERIKKDGKWRWIWPEDWTQVKDLRPGDRVPFPTGGQFNKNSNIDIFYFLLAGLIWGDGTFCGKKLWGYDRCVPRLFVSVKNRPFLDKIRDLSPLPCKVRDQVFSGKRPWAKTGDIQYIQWAPSVGYMLQHKLGLDKTMPAIERRLSPQIMAASRIEAREFLRGWFSTDGSVVTQKYPRIALYAKSTKSLRDAQLLLSKFNIKSVVRDQSHLQTRCRGKMIKRCAVLRITDRESVRGFRDEIGFEDDAKQHKLQSASLAQRIHRRSLGHIVSIEPVGHASVYDIAVDDSHQFVAEGVLVHNCYPNPDLNQDPDWMHDEIYERWLESHGIMIITPVYWWSMPSVLKLMFDRLVCMDGANPDPTTTASPEHGVKDVAKAKALERPRAGAKSKWDYLSNKKLAGRIFAVYVHGDAEGTHMVSHAITETLGWFGLWDAKPQSEISQFVGRYKTYSDSHKHMKEEGAAMDSVKELAESLISTAKEHRKKGMPLPDMPPNEWQK